MMKIIHNNQRQPNTFCDIRLDKWQRTSLNRTDTTDPYFRSLKYPTTASLQNPVNLFPCTCPLVHHVIKQKLFALVGDFHKGFCRLNTLWFGRHVQRLWSNRSLP